MHQGEGGRREAEGMFQGASGKGNRMRLDEICRDLLILLMKGLLYHSAACICQNHAGGFAAAVFIPAFAFICCDPQKVREFFSVFTVSYTDKRNFCACIYRS